MSGFFTAPSRSSIFTTPAPAAAAPGKAVASRPAAGTAAGPAKWTSPYCAALTGTPMAVKAEESGLLSGVGATAASGAGEHSGPLQADGAKPLGLKARRQMSAKLKAGEVQDLLVQQSHERKNARQRAEEDAARARRLRAYEANLATLWESQWEHVQLARLPSDSQVPDAHGRVGVAEREPVLASRLAALLKEHFQRLFDIYLFYAKVDADAAASELYRMTDFTWKALLKDATVVGDDRATQLNTQQASGIFRLVNQRRDNLTLNKGGGKGMDGKGASATPAARAGAAPTGPADYTAAVLEAVQQATDADGFGSSVTKAHYAAGSLYAFTFSEYLEGLIFVALERPPPASAARPASGLTAEGVLAAVQSLLEECILPYANKGQVLEFRRVLLNSTYLSEAATAIEPHFQALYSRYAEALQKNKVGEAFSLKSFLEACAEAGLTGSQLSHVQVKTAFVNSLQISAESAASRRPLLERSEFIEAVFRLAFAYDDSRDQAEAFKSGRKAARKAALRAQVRDPSAMLAAAVKSKLEPAGSDDPPNELEATILQKLPAVCGKLLALLE